MSEEKKPTPSTNVPLLSYRKSEQKLEKDLKKKQSKQQAKKNITHQINRTKFHQRITTIPSEGQLGQKNSQ